MNNSPFIIERTFPAPIATVWNAITNKDEMRQWYFNLAEFKPEAGFQFQFTGGTEEHQYLHICVVTDVVPGRKITYSSKYDGYEGISYVTFKLFADVDKTRLRLTHDGLESFPESNPDFAKKNFVEGWTHIIGTALKDFLDKVR